MSTRIGILGGTFDPIHDGHLAIAEEARVRLGLERVLFIPAAQQPLKPEGHRATPAQRVEMAKLACLSNKMFEVSPLEIERPGPSYTVTTLEELHTAKIGELYFILGADALADLPRWYQAAHILELARIVAVRRPNFEPDLRLLEQALPCLQDRLYMLNGPNLDISSSELRKRVAQGLPIRYQTPDAVVEYIVVHKLYQSPGIVFYGEP